MPIESSNYAWRWLAAGMLWIGSGVIAVAVEPSGSLRAGEPSAAPEPPLVVTAGPLRFSERRLLHEYTYAYGIAAADLNGDGNLDLTSADAEPNSNLYLLLGDGRGEFRHSFIQKYAQQDDQPIRLERHAIGDVNRDGRPDVIIVDLDVVMAFGLAAAVAPDSPDSHQVAWYENLGQPGLGAEWQKHSIATRFPHGFEAVAGDLDGDGDQDVVATAWSAQGRLAWFENTGDPRAAWTTHLLKPTWPNAVTVIVVDLDNDQRLDIVACAERGANELRWWRNEGPSGSGG